MLPVRALLGLVLFSLPLLACGGIDPLGAGGEGGESDGGADVGGGGDATGSGAGQGSGGSVPAEEDPFEQPPAPVPFTDDELASLRADIDDALGSASASYSALIVGLDSGQIVYEKNPDTPRKPASNTKLFTTAASLVAFGEAGRPAVGLYATSVDGGVVSGDLVLVAQHDPSTTPWFGDGSRQAFDALAARLRADGITTITGGVVAKGEFLYEGDSLGTIDFPTERAQAATAFRQALVAAGISVGGGASTATGFEPPSGTTLVLAAPSATMDVIAHAINVPSHNEMADLAMHHLGFAGSGESTYAAGFQKVASVLDQLGVPRGGLELNDGSGLSHANRATARHIVDLFTALSERPEWSAFVGSMAISGLRGTISGRMTGPDTAGRFWGKTGTLTGVIALSGVLFHRHDGQRYLASFLANDVASSTAARGALDAAVVALAADRKAASGVPEAPALHRVTDDGNGQTAQIELGAVDGADGYLVWRSPDGRAWKREDARYIQKTTHRTFTFDGELFVRVTAVGAAGESAPSNVLAVRVSQGDAPSLFVDGSERYAAGPVPENPLGWGDDAAVAHASAMTGPFESASHGLVESGEVGLENYGTVIWSLGRDSTAHETFSGAEQERVRAFVDAGGRLFVSGAEIAYDLLAEGSADDAAFARDVLGIEYGGDDAGTTFAGLAGEGPLLRFSKLGRHEVDFPDVLVPVGSGVDCLSYAGGQPGAACVAVDTASGGRVVTLGFPLEALDDPGAGVNLVSLVTADP